MKNYEVKKVIDLLKVEKSGEVISEMEDKETRASIRFLSSGNIILIPASGSEGLLIFDKETLDHVLRSGIPINDTTENPAIKYQSLLQNIDSSVGEFMSVLERELKISMELNNDSSNILRS